MTGRNHVNPSNVRTSCRTLHTDRIRIGIRTRCQINVDDSMTINRIHGIQLIQRKSFEENLIAAVISPILQFIGGIQIKVLTTLPFILL